MSSIQTSGLPPVTNGNLVEKNVTNYVSNWGLNGQLNAKEQEQFKQLCIAFDLNPIKREIYAVKYGNSCNFIVGYEVYLKRAELSGQLDGWDTEFAKNGDDITCTCTVYRKDRGHPIKSRVFLSEYNTGKNLWVSKPKVMLEKVAIATAFRRAFPCELGGIPYTADELNPNDNLQAIVATPINQQDSAEQLQAEASLKASEAELDRVFDEGKSEV